MRTINSIKWMLLIASVAITIQSCGQAFINKPLDTYDRYRTQKIEHRDKEFVLHTVKEWSKLNWGYFHDLSLSFRMSNDDVEYFIGGVFYSPDRLKMIVWVGDKTPNAKAIEAYQKEDTMLNRMCPTGGDSTYAMTVLVGIRNDTNRFWRLYPFGDRTTDCGPTKAGVINAIGKYYFEDMKDNKMPKIVQSGPKMGLSELVAYGYNLQDSGFWDKSWMWEKDTVGSNGLYRFQVDWYRHPNTPRCNKCAEELITPQINYPEEIWDMYPGSKAIRDSLNRPEVKASIKVVQQAQEQKDAKRWKEQLEKGRR